MSDSPDLIITAEMPRADETAFAEFERAEAFALARLVRSLTLGDCRSKAINDDDAHLMKEGLEKRSAPTARRRAGFCSTRGRIPRL
ncbi:DUF7706 family protein [Pseudomonas putida]